jgi:hypothetical protein
VIRGELAVVVSVSVEKYDAVVVVGTSEVDTVVEIVVDVSKSVVVYESVSVEKYEAVVVNESVSVSVVVYESVSVEKYEAVVVVGDV